MSKEGVTSLSLACGQALPKTVQTVILCGGVDVGVAAAGRAKTSPLGRTKPVPGLARGNTWGR